MTVLIPAYNEGAMVGETIASVAGARYPRERLQIIAIDDGSTDDTWRHIRHAALRFPGLVTPVRLPPIKASAARSPRLPARHGRGDRHGRLRQHHRARCAPRDRRAVPRCPRRRGGGKSRVHNAGPASYRGCCTCVSSCPSIIYAVPNPCSARSTAAPARSPRIAPSSCGRCCPGGEPALSGCALHYGEDRALTNDILAAGYDTVYQRNASYHRRSRNLFQAVQDVPALGSELHPRGIPIRRDRVVAALWSRALAFYESAITNLRYPVGYASIALWAMNALKDRRRSCACAGDHGGVAGLRALLPQERAFLGLRVRILYAYFSFFALTWIFPYAVLTCARAAG